MQYASSMVQLGRLLGCVLLLSLGAAAARASDTFSGGQLTIPTAIIGAAHYSNMVVVPLTVLHIAGGAPVGTVDSYNPATNILTVPSVSVGATTYTNVTATISSLVSIGGVTGADTFNGTYVLSPAVQVLGGGPLYNDVVFAVGSIVSAGGGMPANVRDTYDPGTHDITLMTIQVGSKIYTNAVVTLGNYVTAGGTGIPVPNVVGDTQATAQVAIAAVGLTVGSITSQLSSSIPAGTVISQSPAAGVGAPSGYPINLVVSAGATGTAVPDVVGDTQAAASTAITAAGLTVGSITTQASNTVVAGVVISENPVSGTRVAAGSPVNLLVSAGSGISLVYSFAAVSGNTTGYYPGVLVQATDGTLYGVNQLGGTNHTGNVFKLTLGGAESLLYTFPAATPGSYVPNGLISTSNNTLFGTSGGGGTYGGGTFYKVTTSGVETTLYNFCGCLDNLDFFEGTNPGGLLAGSDGDFYGVTIGGQDSSGTIYKMPPNGLGSVLYAFGSHAGDGAVPIGALILGNDGSFWGVTDQGGTNSTGTVFKWSSALSESVVYSFGPNTGKDAQAPAAGLVQASNGNFYGMSVLGGANNTGTIYSVTPAGKETVLYSFPAPVSGVGAGPVGPLIRGTDGNLYGVTTYAGAYNGGMIFKMTLSGTFSIMHSFSGGTVDAAYPAAIIQGKDGNLYGSARGFGANGGGAIFKLTL